MHSLNGYSRNLLPWPASSRSPSPTSPPQHPASSPQSPAPSPFVIRHSEARPGEFQPISPDIALCDDCLRELFDPDDRRYRYPFINCTNCGPRFTIIQDIPYDRPKTTMAPFKMCPDCQAEYDDPTNRRFHAQPNACPVCGPRVKFQIPNPKPKTKNLTYDEEAIQATRRILAEGGIVAVKGLGGFHLACDATNDKAVTRLRERKGRVDKPFAIMSFDLETVEQYCKVNDEAHLPRAAHRPATPPPQLSHLSPRRPRQQVPRSDVTLHPLSLPASGT